MKAIFPIDTHLSTIAIAYRNARLIADDVLPRVPVSTQEFKYRKFALADGFTLPNTLVGRTSKPNQVEFGYTEALDSTRDYALDEPIPQADIENAPAGYNPLDRATENVSDLIALDREVRTAGVVFNAANYGAANKTQLAGATQWSHADSDPITDIATALDSMIMRATIMVLGQATWSALRKHPKIVQSYHGQAGATEGMVTRDFVRQLFDLDALLVGQGWLNSAKKGQTPVLVRVWGNHASLIYRDTLAGANDRVTFGFTAQWGDRVAGNIADKDMGMRGGWRVRVGESVKELVAANDLGYYFQDAVAA
jgi:hypothetical protein